MASERGAWRVEWAETALRDLFRLDRPVARRIVSKLERAATDPSRFFERLTGSADYKLRVGDYRLLALISHEDRIIYVERVGHRSTIYDRP
ncbi:MAG TPA: type II toxin-antitoxin system RelE/ParE family toxin [Candidatus Thermoplasmatota archaeon]